VLSCIEIVPRKGKFVELPAS
jgi:hypothetical protein